MSFQLIAKLDSVEHSFSHLTDNTGFIFLQNSERQS